jgi:ribosomal 50S subunit-recycling heat shock protein
MRLDKYLKIARIIKRRTVANEACDAGRVTLNGRVARASAEVKPGDIIGIAFGNRTTRVEVLAVQDNVRKEAAADLFRYLPEEEEA